MSQDVLRGAVSEDSEGIRLLDQAVETCRRHYHDTAAVCLNRVRAYLIQGTTDEDYGILSDAAIFEELPYYGPDSDAVFAAIREVRWWLRDHARLLAWERMEKSR
jgi:hypothetical protein